jgi:hypothetical protein
MQDDGPTEDGRRAGIETGPDGKPTGNIVCYPSFNPNCIVVSTPSKGEIASTGFLSLPEPTRFHDELLQKATREINDILLRVTREAKRESHKSGLHLFLAKEGPMLIWVDTMAMQTDDIRKTSAM